MNIYRVINNNPNNFKAVIEAAGKPIAARFADQCIIIANRHKVSLRPNGSVWVGDEELRHMTEEELFQASTVDELAEIKQIAYELLHAFSNNSNQMTEELLATVVNPAPKPIAKATKKRS